MFVLGPWSVPTRMAPLKRTTSQVVLNSFSAIVIVALVIAALLIARRNLRAQRADKRGAARLATFVLAGYAVSWVIAAHHVPDVTSELNIFSRSYGPVLLSAGVLWLIYLALEPYVRRFWPDGILGWTRLMAGYVRDPLVGRDVLLGCVFAVGLTLLEKFYFLVPPLIGRPSGMPLPQSVSALMGGAALLSTLFDLAVSGLFPAMFVVLGYVLLRLAFRRTVFAVAAAFVLLFLVQAQQVLNSAAPMWIALLFQLSLVAIVTTVVVRYGLLVTAIASSVGSVLGDIPMTTSLSQWTATTSNLTIAIVLALVFFGFYASRAGQPLFGNLEGKS